MEIKYNDWIRRKKGGKVVEGIIGAIWKLLINTNLIFDISIVSTMSAINTQIVQGKK